ncbi:MAG TPA: hypothetical protein VNJ08_12740 [Bacteriovoracaceae bacterium]|nr:hypothetical protein [Bacteriovoracaceae bacterium]
MDWKKTFNRGQWVIHSIFAMAILLGIGSTLLTLRLNHLQSTEEERTLKITSLLQELKADDPFEKLGKFLSRAEADKANDKIRNFSQKLAETEELLEIKASKDLGLAVRTFNRLINNNSGISNPGDALKVLGSKVENLKDVAQSQGYKNIGVVAQRMKDRLVLLNPRNAGNSPQVGALQTDMKKLLQLVESSNLSDGEKNTLTVRINGMGNELELLQSLNSHSKDLNAHVNQGSIALAQWLLDAEKKSGDLKGMRLSKQNQLIVVLAGLVCFLITAWMGIAYLFRWQKLKISTQVEMEVKSVIEKGIIGDQRFMMDHYSDFTREDIIRLLDELKIKLNLGTMLHEGLPFAGCLIDHSFKLTWHNHLFLEQFYLSEEEVRSDAFNWDFLRESLNLDSDPVYEALANKLSGIYPVKVKQDELTPMQPYEMYVTPITVNREDRVMVFFYPLVAVKEAIVEQVNLSRDTLNRFIQLWNEERLDQDELKLLEKDFKSNDLIDMYGTLVSLHERIEGEKEEALGTITSLEKENMAYHSVMEEMKKIEEDRKDIIKREFNLAGELKHTFISALEKSDSLLQINRTVLQQNDELKNEAQKMHQMSQEIAKKMRETAEIMGQLDGVRTDYKKLKLELLEVKAKLISINSSLFGQLPVLDEHQQKLANRYKDELARLDYNVCTLDKKLTQLDVLLGKLNMMNEKQPKEQINFNFQTTQKDHEVREALMEIQKALGSEEGKIIDHFKTLHTLMRQDLGKTHAAHSAATSSPTDSEPLHS